MEHNKVGLAMEEDALDRGLGGVRWRTVGGERRNEVETGGVRRRRRGDGLERTRWQGVRWRRGEAEAGRRAARQGYGGGLERLGRR